MRLALIANPHASRFSGRQRDRVVATLGAAHKVELLQTGHAGQATELARQAVAGGAEVVAVPAGCAAAAPAPRSPANGSDSYWSGRRARR